MSDENENTEAEQAEGAPPEETAGTQPDATPDAPAADEETSRKDEQAVSKETVDTYEKVFRIQSPTGKLPAGFPEETYGEAAAREAIAHGWRPAKVGDIAHKVKVTKVEDAPGTIDVLFGLDVVPAAGGGAQPPVGVTPEEDVEAQPEAGEHGNDNDGDE